MDAELTAEEKDRVLARLNQRRSAAATGKLPGLPMAGNMLKLQWVEELSREAQYWANQCSPPATPEESDECRDLFSVTVGQCSASVVGEAPGLKPESMVDMWYMQRRHYRANVTSYVPPKTRVAYYGDFAQMLWANAYMVGCARSRFMTDWHGRMRSVERLVCNLAPRGPSEGRALWTPAAPAAACPPRALPDEQYPALCTYQHYSNESHDVDNSMSLEEHALLNTVLDIERNDSLNYLGSLDEQYLTKMAISTMIDLIIDRNSSIQKRDIFDPLNRSISNMDFITLTEYEHKSIETENGTNELNVNITKTTEIINLVGRPKSYKIEELNAEEHDQITDNTVEVPESEKDRAIHEKDIYADYEFSEAPEIISSTVQKSTLHNKQRFNAVYVSNETETPETEVGIEIQFQNTSTIHMATLSTFTDVSELTDRSQAVTKEFNLTTNYTNANNTLGLDPSDDFFSDPEAVRQLEEELDSMERSLSKPSALSSKVRRELRNLIKNENSPNVADLPENEPNVADLPENETNVADVPEEVLQRLSDENQARPSNQANNKEIFDEEKNQTTMLPMLNMVMKYMPYFKEYKNSIMNRATGITNAASPTYLSRITLCFVLTVNFGV